MFLFFLLGTFITCVSSWYSGDDTFWVLGTYGYHGVHDGLEHAKDFVNEWSVEIEGGEEVAQLIALELGYAYGGPVIGFPNTYTFLKYEHEKQRRAPSQHTSILVSDRRVRWAEQMFVKSRVKRYPTPSPDETLQRVKRLEEEKAFKTKRLDHIRPMFNDELWSQEWYLQDINQNHNLPRLDLNVLPVYLMGFNGSGVRISVLDDGIEHNHTDLRANYVRWAEQMFVKSRVKRYPTPSPDETLQRVKRLEEEKAFKTKRLDHIRPMFNDELWSQEWYLQDINQNHNLPRLDLNVLPVYLMGFNGSGVRISVLDDGIEHNHTDLRANYDPEISWDSNDGDPDPTPRFEDLKKNSHGTRCAGEIAMTANNLKCGVGVAWGAKVGGVRMLDGRITDRIEGEAIAFAVDKVDIYSASWGPNDDGGTVEGPGRLASEAFKRGITEGRGGKGAIYVWANGNGGGYGDNCNCDGYSSSIYTISIGSASQHGLFPWYGEICTSTLATAYSSGAYRDQKIATTDTGDSCTLGHTGTSAAAPLAAGIIALALSANPNLTWRDVQHLIVFTSEYAPLSANPGWQINGAGFYFDVRFGFGLLNAGALVAISLNWTTVPEKHVCYVEAVPLEKEKLRLISKSSNVILILVDENCEVDYIEHVEIIVNVRYTRRGALEIYLASPAETKIQLLSARSRDVSKAGFVNWPLMSVATWGENPKGIWKVIFSDKTNEENVGNIGQISLIIHGTKEMPEHMRNGPRKYGNNQNYPEVLNEYNLEDNNDVDTTNTVTYDTSVDVILGEHPNADVTDLDSTITLAEVEKEWQRIHHRIIYMTDTEN